MNQAETGGARRPGRRRPVAAATATPTVERSRAYRQIVNPFEPLRIYSDDHVAAMEHLQAHAARGEVVTGLLYVDPAAEDLHEHLDTVAQPLNTLGAADLCPGSAVLAALNASLR